MPNRGDARVVSRRRTASHLVVWRQGDTGCPIGTRQAVRASGPVPQIGPAAALGSLAVSRSLRLTQVSKYLARHLRHDPHRIGLHLDDAGWADVEELRACAAADGFPLLTA